MPHYFSTISINSTNVSNAKHNHFFILVYVNLLAKIISMVKKRIKMPLCTNLSHSMMLRISMLQWFSYSLLRTSKTLSSKKTGHHFPTVACSSLSHCIIYKQRNTWEILDWTITSIWEAESLDVELISCLAQNRLILLALNPVIWGYSACNSLLISL